MFWGSCRKGQLPVVALLWRFTERERERASSAPWWCWVRAESSELAYTHLNSSSVLYCLHQERTRCFFSCLQICDLSFSQVYMHFPNLHSSFSPFNTLLWVSAWFAVTSADSILYMFGGFFWLPLVKLECACYFFFSMDLGWEH